MHTFTCRLSPGDCDIVYWLVYLFVVGSDFAGLDLSNDDLLEYFSFQTASKNNYVPDATLPPGEPWLRGGPSQALLSLP